MAEREEEKELSQSSSTSSSYQSTGAENDVSGSMPAVQEQRHSGAAPRRLSSSLMSSTARSIPHESHEDEEEGKEEEEEAAYIERSRRTMSSSSHHHHHHHHHQNDEEDVASPAPSTFSYASSSSASSSSFSSSPLPSRVESLPLRGKTKPHSSTRHPRPCLRSCGIFVFALGLLTLGAAVLSHTMLPSLRDKQALKMIVIDSTDHPSYLEWAEGPVGGDSPVHLRFYFFHLVNGKDFVKSSTKPLYEEKGPYVFKQKSKKVDVVFSEDGTLVSYVLLTQHDYVPALSGSGVALTDSVSMVNLAYSAAVHSFGSETNILRYGARMALAEVQRAWKEEFLPALKENALVATARMAIQLCDETLDKAYYPDDGTAVRWGGGCVDMPGPAGLKQCGFGNPAFLKALLIKEDSDDVELLQMCLDTGIGSSAGQFIPLATVKNLWNPADRLSPFNVERASTSTRYGIAQWLNADANTKDTLMSYFKLNLYQFTKLQAYLRAVYDSPLLERFALKNFLKALPPAEAPMAANEVHDWASLTWRQWAVGDVLQLLNASPEPESVMPETPPELSFYLAKEGRPVWGNGAFGNLRWSLAQTQCFFDTVLTQTDGDFFAETLLGLPPAPNKTPRKLFTSQSSPDAAFQAASKAALQACLVSKDGWSVMQGYFNYLAKQFVAPYMEEKVLSANGGLVVTRSVWSWLQGRPEPILALSLEPNDPRIQFGFLGEDLKLEAPGLCEQLSDVENAYTACEPVFASGDPTKQLKYYQKVPNTYHTGKGAPEQLGALAKYKKDEVAWGIWPRANVPILGGARSVQGSVIQYGYSEGEQFPPLNRILKALQGKQVGVQGGEGSASAIEVTGKVSNGAEELAKGLKETLSTLAVDDVGKKTEGEEDPGESNTDLLIFLSKFVMPLRFRYDGPKEEPLQGIEGLLRFVLSPTNFSPKRSDAKTFSMDGPNAREGLLNLTDLQGLPLYLSPPHYTGYTSLQSMMEPGVTYSAMGEEEASEGSHLDIDPYTGRTLAATIRMQVSSSTQGGAAIYDVFHPKVHEAELVPLLWMTQQAEVGALDAATFKERVDKPLQMVNKVQLITLLAGMGVTALGLLMMMAACVSACRARRAAAAAAAAAAAPKEKKVEGVQVEEVEEGAVATEII